MIILKRERESGGTLKDTLKTEITDVAPLDTNGWKLFKLNELFNIKYGINMELLNCTENFETGINFVARTSENNGVSSKVEIIDGKVPQKAGLITVAGGGSVLSTFYQPKDFYSGRDLYTLETIEDVDIYAKMFLITLIRKERFKYSYGRQANKTLPFIEIKLPITSSGKPDYQFMSN